MSTRQPIFAAMASGEVPLADCFIMTTFSFSIKDLPRPIAVGDVKSYYRGSPVNQQECDRQQATMHETM